jgi:hypothetical protein
MKNKILTVKEELYLDLAVFLINHSTESELESKIQILSNSPLFISLIDDSNVLNSFARVKNNFLKEGFIEDINKAFNQLSITKSEKIELFQELYMLYLWDGNNLSEGENMVISLYQQLLEIDQSELEKINDDSIEEIIIRKEIVNDLGLDKKGCFTSVLMFVFIAVLLYN